MKYKGASKQIIHDISALFLGHLEDSFCGDHAMIVAIRISVDSFRFFEKYEHLDGVDAEEIGYLVNTIRSGVDAFFSCEEYFRVAIGQAGSRPQWATHAEFSTMRKEYFELFNKLSVAELSFNLRCHTLLRLLELQLQFMAANFHQARTDIEPAAD